MPGVKYSYDVGMMGLDVAVSLERAGFSIRKRRIQQRKIPAKHKINKEESVEWVKKTFGVEIV
jgi:large subunit ribosomal protein L5